MSHSACAFCKPHLGLCTLGVDSVYSLLWRDQGGGKAFQSCKIPETVLFFDRQPPQWYFTSAKDGRSLLRKNRWNVTEDTICQTFLKHNHVSEVVAYYLSDEISSAGEVVIVMEYFDKNSLREFVHNQFVATKEARKSGILQAFVDPKGGSNSLIQASWSPSLCVIERKVNLNRLSDRHAHMYDRVVTFEGASHLALDSPMTSPSLVGRIQGVCAEIARHIAMTAGEIWTVRKMECFFKFDELDQLHFLWCSNLETVPVYASKPLGADHHYSSAVQPTARPRMTIPVDAFRSIRPPKGIISQPFLPASSGNTDADAPSRGFDLCPSCNQLFPQSDFIYDITYKMAIQSSDAQQQKDVPRPFSVPTSGSEEEEERAMGMSKKGPVLVVPAVLKRVQPALTLDRYLKLRNQQAFLYKTFKVCKVCGPRMLSCASEKVNEEESALAASDHHLAESQRPRTSGASALSQSSRRHGHASSSRVSSSKRSLSAHVSRPQPQPKPKPTPGSVESPDRYSHAGDSDRITAAQHYDDDFECDNDEDDKDNRNGKSYDDDDGDDDGDDVVREASDGEEFGEDTAFVVRRAPSSLIHRKPSSAPATRAVPPPKTEQEFSQMVSRLAAPRIVTSKWDERREMLERQEVNHQKRQKEHQERLLTKLRQEELLMASFAKLAGTSSFNLASRTHKSSQNLLLSHARPPVHTTKSAKHHSQAGGDQAVSSEAPRLAATSGSVTARQSSSSSSFSGSKVSVRRSLSASTHASSRYCSGEAAEEDVSREAGDADPEAIEDDDIIVLDDGQRIGRRCHGQDAVFDELSDDEERQVLMDAIRS
eukprot:ANDGO_08195.mRNA.1 hypothetical protein AURANDRAFT_67841